MPSYAALPFDRAGSSYALAPLQPLARRKVRFIANPRARGGGPWRALGPELAQRVQNTASVVDLCETVAAGHATTLAAEAVAMHYDAVVAIGGDGTMNEVARALVHTPTALGLVPLGSGNGLARHLGLPRQPLAAAAAVLSSTAHARAIDTGRINGRLFCNVMGFGVDAEVSRRFNRMTHRGWPGYVRAVWSVLRDRQVENCQVAAGERRHAHRGFLVAVANSAQYGNNMRIAPRASVCDGELDLVLVEAVGLFRIAQLIVRMAAGNFDRGPGVQHWRAPHFRLQRDREGLVHTDGETLPCEALLEVSVVPASLRVVLPATTETAL